MLVPLLVGAANKLHDLSQGGHLRHPSPFISIKEH